MGLESRTIVSSKGMSVDIRVVEDVGKKIVVSGSGGHFGLDIGGEENAGHYSIGDRVLTISTFFEGTNLVYGPLEEGEVYIFPEAREEETDTGLIMRSRGIEVRKNKVITPMFNASGVPALSVIRGSPRSCADFEIPFPADSRGYLARFEYIKNPEVLSVASGEDYVLTVGPVVPDKLYVPGQE